MTVEAPSTDEPHRPDASESPIEGAPERLAGFIYGTLVALAMIVAGVKVYPDSTGRIAVFVVLTSFVLWLAHDLLLMPSPAAETAAARSAAIIRASRPREARAPRQRD